VVGRDLGELAAEGAFAGTNGEAVGADAVGLRERGSPRERLAQRGSLGVEMCVHRQLLRDHERRDEDDVRSPVCGEPTGEVERVLGFLQPEQRHDDAAIPEHHSTWYGTLARMTPGSSSSSRLT
jgi:hypothetical protein